MDKNGDRNTNELIFSGEDDNRKAVSHNTKVIPISKTPTYIDAKNDFVPVRLNFSKRRIYIVIYRKPKRKFRKSLCVSSRLSFMFSSQKTDQTIELPVARTTPKGFVILKFHLPCNEITNTPEKQTRSAIMVLIVIR